VEFSLEQLRELVAMVNQTDITELTLESGDLRLNIRKSETRTGMIAAAPAPVVAAPVMVPAVADSMPVSMPTIAEALPSKKLLEITSPMVGTFYRAPSPDDPPFVESGDSIKKGQTVCIIEAMKLMNELEAEYSGKIVEILVENAQPVEYGQVLMRVEPLV
jgi:acetyl-CoA carboxylase biotin carboxyl carrier protein